MRSIVFKLKVLSAEINHFCSCCIKWQKLWAHCININLHGGKNNTNTAAAAAAGTKSNGAENKYFNNFFAPNRRHTQTHTHTLNIFVATKFQHIAMYNEWNRNEIKFNKYEKAGVNVGHFEGKSRGGRGKAFFFTANPFWGKYTFQCVCDEVLCVAEKYLHSDAFKQLVNWFIRND